MKDKCRFKQVTAWALAVLVGLLSYGGIGVYAETATAGFTNFPLSLDNQVKATYQPDPGRLDISGHGQIDRERWEMMGENIDAANFTDEFTGWAGVEAFDIYFQNDAQGQIKLPDNCICLFDSFDRQIYFNDAVDTTGVDTMAYMFYGASAFNQPINFNTPNLTDTGYMFYQASAFNQPVDFNTSKVINMCKMFYQATAFNQSVEFDISKVGDVKHMFTDSQVRSVIFNNSDSNKDVDCTEIFNGCANLQNLQFKGFKNMAIQSFGGDYYVQKLGDPAPVAKAASEPFSFEDNASYHVYLQQPLSFEMDLSLDGNVLAEYDDNLAKLTISGNGLIDRAKWLEMARKINPNNFSLGPNQLYHGWAGSEAFDIYFESVGANQIQLPDDSAFLFAEFDRQIYFGEAVDTAAVISMKSLFKDAPNFNQPVNFNTQNVHDMSEMFAGATTFNQVIDFNIGQVDDVSSMFKLSAVEQVTLNNVPNNLNVAADGLFLGCTKLEDLRFSGLKDVSIDGFSGAYFVVKNGGAAVAKNASESYNCADNQTYHIYLQPQIVVGVPQLSAAKFGDVIKLSWPAVSDVTGYQVYRAEALNGDYTLLKTTSLLTYNDAALTPGNPYFYKLRAYKKVAGNYFFGEFSEVKGCYAPVDEPGTPNLSATKYGTAIKLTWNQLDDATGYQLYRASALNGSYTLLKTTSLLNYNDGAVTAGKPYFYKLRAYKKVAGNYIFGQFSAVKGCYAPDDKPGTPNLTVAKDGLAIKLSWNQTDDATGYQLYRASALNGSYTLLKTTSLLNYSDAAVTAGKPYFYKLRAYKKDGGNYVFGDFSEIKGYYAPNGLTAPQLSVAKSGNGIKLNWDSQQYATGYQVYRADAVDGPYTLFKTTSLTSYTNSGSLVPGMPYFYKVRAYRKNGTSYTFSDYSTFKGYYAPGALVKPAAPSLTLDENAGGIRLNWNGQPRITGYHVFRSSSPDKPFEYLKTLAGDAHVYTNLSDLNSGRPYYYKIRAYRTAGGVTKYGDFSTVKGLFAGTNEPALDAVAFNLSKNASVTAPNVRITWSGVSGADGYCVYRWDGVHKNWIGLKATGPNARVYTNLSGVVSGKTFFYGMRPLHISGGTTYYGNIGQAKGYKVE